MNIVLVYNPLAGNSQTLTSLRKEFQAEDIIIEKAIPFTADIEKQLRKFIQKGAFITVIGGDGTISAVAGHLAKTKAVLVPLPGGTLNHFVRDLDISRNLTEAIGRLRHAKVHRVDIAQVNEKFFINNSGIGLYPSSLHVRERFEDKLGKWPAAIIASLRVFIKFRVHTLEIDGRTIRTPFVFVGNNQYAIDRIGGASRTTLDQGTLSVFVAKTTSRWKLLQLIGYALVGRAAYLNEFEQREVAHLRIKSASMLSVSRDGEVERLASPVVYAIHVGALRVLY